MKLIALCLSVLFVWLMVLGWLCFTEWLDQRRRNTRGPRLGALLIVNREVKR
jgi:hypothetical protein